MKSWQLESAVDREKTLSALAFVQMTSFTHRMVNTLSGGEKRRVALATLLAQDPAIYLLDEPANHLDLHFQASLLPDLCSALKQKNKTVFMSLHDINLATHLTDKCLLLMGNGEHLLGETREIMTRENLETLYNQPFEEIETDNWEQNGYPVSKHNRIKYPIAVGIDFTSADSINCPTLSSCLIIIKSNDA